MIVTWLLSVQLWTEHPPKIEVLFTKEFATHEECMNERAVRAKKDLQVFCLMKVKNV